MDRAVGRCDDIFKQKKQLTKSNARVGWILEAHLHRQYYNL